MIEILRAWIAHGIRLWRGLQPRQRLLAGGAAALVLALIAFFSFVSSRGCSSRLDVEARVASLSAQFQEEASRGGMTVGALASALKEMNEAASAFETHKDPKAYCEALKAISKAHRLDE